MHITQPARFAHSVLFFAPKLVDAILTGAAVDVASGSLRTPTAAGGSAPLDGGISSAATISALSSKLGSLAAGGGGGAAVAGRRMLLGGGPVIPQTTGVRAALLTAVPFVLSAFTAVWLGKRSQERGDRCRHMAVPWFCSAALFLAFSFAAQLSPEAGFACLTLAVVTATAPNALLNTLASAVSAGPAQALSLSVYNAGASRLISGRHLGGWEFAQ